jgi:hypothetical protein
MRRGLPLTDADLDRAKRDPAFRHKLLQESLESLLGKLQKQRQTPRASVATPAQMREGVTLAVRLAELIQAGASPPRNR